MWGGVSEASASTSGRPRVIQINPAIKTVGERIHRNPLRKQKIMLKEMNISTRWMSRRIRNDLLPTVT